MSGKRLYSFLLFVGVLLALTTGLMINISVTHKERFRFDLGRGSPSILTPKTVAFLTGLAEPVKVTYLVTERRRMPTAMGNVESDVSVILREMKRHAGGKFIYEVIHPEDNPQITRTVGRHHISSFQYKTIFKDEHSVDTVWSGVLIEYKGQTRTIPYITRDHLFFLGDRIITHLQQITAGYTPGIAVGVGSGAPHSLLEKTITQFNFGVVKNYDLARGKPIPQDADMAFVIGPSDIAQETVDSIRAFIRDGKDVIITVSNYSIVPDISTGRLAYRVVPRRRGPLYEYLNDMGIRLEEKIVMEKKNFRDMPFFLTLPTAQVNYTGFRLQRGGTLYAPLTAPISVDQAKLKKSGHDSDALLYSSVNAYTLPFSSDRPRLLSDADIAAPAGPGSGVQSLGIVVTSEKAWEGRLFLYACHDFFSDAASGAGASQLYLKNFLMTYAVPTTMNSIQSGRELLPALSSVSATGRLVWRLAVIAGIPLLWFIAMLVKIVGRQFAGAGVRRAHLKAAILMAAGACAGVVLIAGMRALGTAGIDMTAGKLNRINPVSAQWLAGNLSEEVNVTYYVSAAEDMPLNARTMARDVESKLRALARASSRKLRVRVEKVTRDAGESLTNDLRKYGIKPFKMRMIENDRYVEKMAYSGLVFTRPDGTYEAEPMLTRANATRLEFVVVSSIKRLLEQQRPRIALVADLPHLTAGEFWELQQLEAQIQPRSEDVYRRFIELLRNEGYQVNIYDPKDKQEYTEDILMYIQPWVVSDDMKREVNRCLRTGKKVVLAVQHFYMQARKYAGRAYSVSYWPQPQFSRIDELLAPYGIELVREVLFDQSKAPMDTREQIRWGAYKRWDNRAPDAQPFIIRAIPSNFDTTSPITSRLSDILFVWGNRWRTIKGTFPSALNWCPLISTTEDTWSLDWQGGFLEESILQGGSYFDKKQTLCALVEGVFPSLYGAPTAAEKGMLLLIGSSKLFDNEQLDTTRYDNERFILNFMAYLGYGPTLAGIQASGGGEAKGFGFVPPGRKLLWRFAVVVLVPLLLALYGLRRISRRSSRSVSYAPR